jgi:hypothetical protein
MAVISVADDGLNVMVTVASVMVSESAQIVKSAARGLTAATINVVEYTLNQTTVGKGVCQALSD